MPTIWLDKSSNIQIHSEIRTRETIKQEINWITDGSKTRTGFRAGIYGQSLRCDMSQNLKEYLKIGYREKNFFTCSDS